MTSVSSPEMVGEAWRTLAVSLSGERWLLVCLMNVGCLIYFGCQFV